MPVLFRKLGIAAAGAICLAAALPAAASKPPVVLSQTFSEDESAVTVAPAKGAPVCTVNFTEVTDARRDKTTAGVVYDRSVQSPQDTQAWMRSILGGLSRRGITPQFDVSSAGPALPAAKFSLQTVWLSGVGDSLSANVIMAVDAAGPGGQTLSQTYRGRVSKMNWASGAGEMEKALDDAFSDALNRMAPDLSKLCPAG